MTDKSVTGDDQIEKMAADVENLLAERIGQANFAAADEIKADAQRSITNGSISGAGHVPSQPGEPPNADTRNLDKSIVSKRIGITDAEVRVTADYAAAQEFGAPEIDLEERPYMRPALAKNEGRIEELVESAVRSVLNV